MLFNFRTEVNKHWSLKNNNRIRRCGARMFLGKEQKLLADKEHLVLMLRQAWGNKKPLDCYLHADIKMYFKDFYTKLGDMNMKLGDLDNLLCLPVDALQAADVITNDALILSFDGSRKHPSIVGCNYLEISLYEIPAP